MTGIDTLLCAILRGDVTSWSPLDDLNVEQLLAGAFRHNIHLILFDTLKRLPSWARWPLRLREALEKAAVAACAFDLLHEQELRRVLGRLDGAGLRPILMKGVPLAYTLYRSSALRPRSDTDLLIRESDAKALAHILTELGYSGPDIKTDKLASYECQYSLPSAIGVEHTLDIHWKINNAQVFAETLTFDEISAEAVNIPFLAPCAFGLSHKHALLLACMHRFGHTHAPFYTDAGTAYAGDNLLWVYDIHLLCSSLTPMRWSEFAELAGAKRIATFCLDGLNAAREAFKTRISPDVVNALEVAAVGESVDVKRLRESGVAWFLANVRSLPHYGQRLGWIKQMAMPTPAYMMEKYHTDSWLALPFLYGYRAGNGILKRMRRSKLQQSANQ